MVATPTADFRAKYGVPEHVLILDPSGGTLQDNGERLELKRPDMPDTNGVAYLTVDEVRYDDKAPWPPGADGRRVPRRRRQAIGKPYRRIERQEAQPLPPARSPHGLPPGRSQTISGSLSRRARSEDASSANPSA